MLYNFDAYFLGKTERNKYSENDVCRMAAYFTQDGKCYVTGLPLQSGERELHHRLPRIYGGQDTPENLIMLNRHIHRMVHVCNFDELYDLMRIKPLTDKQLSLLNQLRLEARNKPIDPTQFTPAINAEGV